MRGLPCLIVSCFALFGCCLLEAAILWRERAGQGGSGGEDRSERAGRKERRGNCGRGVVYCMREEFIFNKK